MHGFVLQAVGPAGTTASELGQLGEQRVNALEDDLRRVAQPNFFRLDVPGWFGT
ncbi:hypothetical protein [Micromonospora sp. WMMD712]|uniref:hypothetical protein n=1 Tax=Micromonospora sp. WMMD712 TaxID=3016096 RepID=UPI00249A6410|nr:hypothetical protein [Micromonospora sp. WMMD712]WFE59091.1 hypothetical protein O7633_20590 [Micromonospora sp. WMMD712]